MSVPSLPQPGLRLPCVLLGFALAAALSACDGDKLSERAVNDAVRRHVAAQPDVCVPERVVYTQSLSSGKLPRALQAHGLTLIRNAQQATRSGQRTVYEWTTEGQKYLKQIHENGVSVRALCFAKRTLDQVTTQHPPQKGQLLPVWTVQFTTCRWRSGLEPRRTGACRHARNCPGPHAGECLADRAPAAARRAVGGRALIEVGYAGSVAMI